MVLNADVQRDPVRRQNAVATAEVHREFAVAGKIRAADTAEQIKSAGHGCIAAEKHLARKEVVAEREVVIREVPLSGRNELDIAQSLEARASGERAPKRALEEEVLADVIRGSEAVDRIGAKVLDRQRTVLHAKFDILRLDFGHLDLAALDLRVDHARRVGIAVLIRAGCVARRLRCTTIVPVKQLMYRGTTAERDERDQ